MKKLFALLLAIIFAVTPLFGCVTEHNSDEPSDVTAEPAGEAQKDPQILADFSNFELIINVYRKIVELYLQYESLDDDEYFIFPDELSRDSYDLLFFSVLCLAPRDSNGLSTNCYGRFGYTLKDLNKDGDLELILRLDDHKIICVYTMLDGKAKLLYRSWNRQNCWIDPDGLLHINHSSGAGSFSNEICEISENEGYLLLTERWGSDGYDAESNALKYYISADNGVKNYISESEYKKWESDLPYADFDATEYTNEYLEFIPIFDDQHPMPKPSDKTVSPPSYDKKESVSEILTKAIKQYRKAIDSVSSYNKIASFSFVDMNGDGIVEMKLNGCGANNYVVGYEIDYNSGIQGFELREEDGRCIYGVRKDGVFTVHSGSEKRTVKISDGYDLITLAKMSEEGFFVNGIAVTEKEYQNFHDGLCREYPESYEMNEENLEKYLTVEHMLDPSLFCNDEHGTDFEIYNDVEKWYWYK